MVLVHSGLVVCVQYYYGKKCHIVIDGMIREMSGYYSLTSPGL